MTQIQHLPDLVSDAETLHADTLAAYRCEAARAERIADRTRINTALGVGTVAMTGPIAATAYGLTGWPFAALPLACIVYAVTQTVRLNAAETAARGHWEDLSRVETAVHADTVAQLPDGR